MSSYAPEINIVGAVLGSPVGDLGHTFRRLNGSYLAALPALVVAALAKTYPDLNRVIEQHATEDGRALLHRLERMTTLEAVIRLFRKDMDDLVQPPLEEVLQMPEVQYVFENIKLGTAVPTPPVLIVQAVHDSVIDVDDIDDLAHLYSSGGAQVTYHRDMFSEHMLLHPMSAPMTLRWLTDRFAGRPLDEHIVRTKWPTLLNPMTYAGMCATRRHRRPGDVGRPGSVPPALSRLRRTDRPRRTQRVRFERPARRRGRLAAWPLPAMRRRARPARQEATASRRSAAGRDRRTPAALR